MAASPEFYKAAEAPAFSPSCAPVLLGAGAGYSCRTPTAGSGGDDDNSYRTPTGNGISYLREPTTCPPAPRKPPPPPMCRKRLFQVQTGEGNQRQPKPCESSPVVPVISLRLDELERLFRPHPPPRPTADKRRRSSKARHLDTELN